MGEVSPAREVELDRPDIDFRRRAVAAVGAEIGHVANPGGGGQIEEARDLTGELDPHGWGDEIDTIDAIQRRSIGRRLVPVERHIGATPRGRARLQAPREEFSRHERSGSPGPAEHKCLPS